MKSIGILLTILMAVSACEKRKPNVELVRNMMNSPSIKEQDYNPDAADGRAMMDPPEHTVSMNNPRYKYAKQPELAKKMPNPLVDAVDLERGRLMYETYCMVCHGQMGKGDGTVAEYMALKPPVLTSDKIKAWTDGEIYHIIAVGRGLMGQYGSQVRHMDRWHIVNYVRELQKKDEGK